MATRKTTFTAALLSSPSAFSPLCAFRRRLSLCAFGAKSATTTTMTKLEPPASSFLAKLKAAPNTSPNVVVCAGRQSVLYAQPPDRLSHARRSPKLFPRVGCIVVVVVVVLRLANSQNSQQVGLLDELQHSVFPASSANDARAFKPRRRKSKVGALEHC